MRGRKEYSRAEIREWGRTICRLREEGTFKELISAEIEVSDWTIKALSETIETSHVTIIKWKKGTHYPHGHMILRLAEALHGGKGEKADKECLRYIKMIDRERRQKK